MTASSSASHMLASRHIGNRDSEFRSKHWKLINNALSGGSRGVTRRGSLFHVIIIRVT